MSEEKRRKPGFFTRLFDLKHVEAPEEETEGAEAAAAPSVDQDAPVVEELHPAETAEVAVSEGAEERPGVLKRWFGRKEKPAEPDAPEEAPEISTVAATEEEKRASWFRRLSQRLGKTRKGLYDRVRSVVGLSGKRDE